jgi:hypothetical protein
MLEMNEATLHVNEHEGMICLRSMQDLRCTCEQLQD